MTKSIEEMNPRFLEMARRSGNPNLKPKPLEETIPELQDYIYLPKHNIYVAKERSHFNLTWYETHEALQKENSRMLTLREFVDFIGYLKNEYQDKKEAKKILDEILTVREPFRGEWLDAYFEYVHYNLYLIKYNHRIINNELRPLNTEPLEKCLMEGHTSNIYIDLFSVNRQGLPEKKSNKEEIRYWPPKNESVAGFHTGSPSSPSCFYHATLSCHIPIKLTHPNEGVRPVKGKI